MIIISFFINLISLIGDWLLFSFPLNQGLMELSDYKRFVKDFDKTSKSMAKISPWYWIMPNLKIHFEKSRAQKVLKSIIKDEDDFRTAINFTNKATAWYFVGLAGWLKMICSVYEFLEEFELRNLGWWLLLVVIVLTFAGLFSAYYRVSSHRQKVILAKFEKE